MTEFNEFIEQLIELFNSADGAFASFGSILGSIFLILELIVSFAATIFGAAFTVATWVVSIVAAVVSFIYFLIKYFLRAIPTYKVAKNANFKQAWLVWIPFFQSLICTFVISRISGKEEFTILNGKIKIKDSSVVMLVYALVYFFADAIISGLLLLVNVIPGLGQVIGSFGTLLYFLPTIFLGIVNYVFLRDTLDLFKENKKKNQTHSFIVTVLDAFITCGWARVVYLITIMKLKPLPKDEPICEEPAPQPEQPLLIEQ